MNRFAFYIHYPFCKSKCPYCAFASVIDQDNFSAKYRQFLIDEIQIRANQLPWKNGQLHSLYIGGGTPSLMPPDYIDLLFDAIGSCFDLPPDIEITIEANPGTVHNDHLQAFRQKGINRLSMGAQSFQSGELLTLGRRHSVDEIANAVQNGRDAGFENISLDLIYGVPRQTVESFADSILQAINLGIEHLSAYTLTIESGTPFENQVNSGKMQPPDPDLLADQYDVLCDIMSRAGFQHYELTNFAKPDKYSRHNFAYWERTPYLGVGTAAHSFDGQRRFWNPRDVDIYCDNVGSGKNISSGEELITLKQALEEQIYLSLRIRDGLDKNILINMFPPNSNIAERIDELSDANFLYELDNRLHIPENRWLLLDEVVLRLCGDEL